MHRGPSDDAYVSGDLSGLPDIDVEQLGRLAKRVGTLEPFACRERVAKAKTSLQDAVLDRINVSIAVRMSREKLSRDLMELVVELLAKKQIPLNGPERHELIKQLLDDMLALGPLEPLLADDTVSEIMINGANRVFIEQEGKVTLSDVVFRDQAHILAIATRIVSAIGRRVDESSPICDARLADGSRVNIILPPLALDGPTITIRKFSNKKIMLDTMVKLGSLSLPMAKLFHILGQSRANILISGGTGSGKTTLLNALSQVINVNERDRHHRRRRRTAIATTACCPPGNTSAQFGGTRRSYNARSSKKRPTHAPRPNHRRRNARRRSS